MWNEFPVFIYIFIWRKVFGRRLEEEKMLLELEFFFMLYVLQARAETYECNETDAGTVAVRERKTWEDNAAVKPEKEWIKETWKKCQTTWVSVILSFMNLE